MNRNRVHRVKAIARKRVFALKTFVGRKRGIKREGCVTRGRVMRRAMSAWGIEGVSVGVLETSDSPSGFRLAGHRTAITECKPAQRYHPFVFRVKSVATIWVAALLGCQPKLINNFELFI